MVAIYQLKLWFFFVKNLKNLIAKLTLIKKMLFSIQFNSIRFERKKSKDSEIHWNNNNNKKKNRPGTIIRKIFFSFVIWNWKKRKFLWFFFVLFLMLTNEKKSWMMMYSVLVFVLNKKKRKFQSIWNEFDFKWFEDYFSHFFSTQTHTQARNLSPWPPPPRIHF